LLPDVEGPMRQAIRDLIRQNRRLTWAATALQMVENEPALRENGLHPSTLRGWADDDDLPYPGDPYWRT
jgi:hypothetical protein